MRDYKHVKVPRSYRSTANRPTVKRFELGPAGGRSRSSGPGIKKAVMQVLSAVVVAGGIWVSWQAYQTVTHAEMFQIAGVDIKGAKQVGDAELKKIAGVFTGKNIFSVDMETAVRRARENSWVKDVRIYRRLPNRISMVFVERIPFAFLETDRGRFLIDSDGVVIERIMKESAPEWKLPCVAIKDTIARPGEQVTADGLDEASQLLAEIGARGGWQSHDVTIKAGSPESLSILYAGHEFKIGAGRYAEKLRRLGEILADVKQRGLEISYVDLRPDRQAAVMVKNDRVRGPGAGGKGKKKT
jgi:cell division septal protein FtsQ